MLVEFKSLESVLHCIIYMIYIERIIHTQEYILDDNIQTLHCYTQSYIIDAQKAETDKEVT